MARVIETTVYKDLYDDTVWSVCSFPVSNDLPDLGVEILKEACHD